MAGTVCFDVGGTKFKVSRSLVGSYPNTMLARLISDRWKSNSKKENDEFFIDRDGILFQYVLHYMRDQKVHLPLTVCRESILKELQYYGFESVSDDALCCSSAIYQTAINIVTCKNLHQADIQNVDNAITDLEQSIINLHQTKSYMSIVYQCFSSFSQKGRHFENRFDIYSTSSWHRYFFPFNQELFDKIAAKYGLQYESHRTKGFYLLVKVGRLDNEE